MMLRKWEAKTSERRLLKRVFKTREILAREAEEA